MAFPFGTNRPLVTRLAFHGTNGAPATAVKYGMHTPGVELSDLLKTGVFDKIRGGIISPMIETRGQSTHQAETDSGMCGFMSAPVGCGDSLSRAT